MTIKFPKENIWKQVNIGDKFGDIVSSFNIDLTKKFGSIKASPRFLVNITTADAALLDVAPFAIVYIDDDSKWFAGAGADTFRGDNLPNEAFALFVPGSGDPNWETTARPDLAYFNGLLYGVDGELQRLNDNSAAWTQIAIVGTPCGAPLISFGATGRLYFKAGIDAMASINTAETLVEATNTYALDLNDETQPISCGKASADFIWIGTIAQAGERARVHKWNGSSTAVTATYEIPAQAVLAMTIQNNVPWLFDSNGVLRMLNGGAFVEVDRIPFKEGKTIRPLTAGAHTTYLCHYNGMDSDKDNIYLNLNTTYADGTTDERCPSGVWVYNKRTGLHHYGSFGTTKSGGTIVDYGGAKVSAIGAIRVAKVNDTATNGTLLAGATIFTSATVTTVGIFYNDSNDTLQKASTIVLSKVFSPNLKETWQKFYARLRKFLNSTDKIVVKYRTEEDEVDEGTITYVTTTTFTSSDFGSAAVGDEVEIIQGVGAGRTAHITAINGTTYTIDETITGATTQTAKARVQSWKKIASFSNQTDEIADFPVGDASAWVQFKIWILWTGDNEIHDLILAHTANQKIE